MDLKLICFKDFTYTYFSKTSTSPLNSYKIVKRPFGFTEGLGNLPKMFLKLPLVMSSSSAMKVVLLEP